MFRAPPGVTIGGARLRMNYLNGVLSSVLRRGGPLEHPTATPLRDALVDDVSKALWMLACPVGFLLLSACSNVARLQLAF